VYGAFHFAFTFWIFQWLTDQASFVTMAAAAQYYFTSNAEHEGEAQVCLGLEWSFIHHAGSLALGSLI